jgi:hypothetical protein
MNEIKIYIKGRTGFKPVITAKLGGAWTPTESSINVDTIMLLTIGESQLEDLKRSIGQDLISVYELKFLTGLDSRDALELSKVQRSEAPLEMNAWTGKHSNIRAKENQLPQHDPGVPVF